jgi:adenylate kinase family enzyme
MKRVALVSTASGCGKTTLARELARRLDVPCYELDALNHRPGWTEATPAELRAAVAPLVAEELWVIDGAYRGKIGNLVLEAADTVVWLDLPLHVWLPRLIRRTTRRVVRREELWQGNRETVRGALWGRNALVPYAIRNHRRRRRLYPVELAPYPVVRLRSTADVEHWLSQVAPGG